MDVEQRISIPYMPDGRPAPAVMTADEVAAFLRLDGNAIRTLKYWRDQGVLRGVRMGRKIRYPLGEVMRFIDRKLANGRT
jgi:hypothetical protein